MKNFNEIVLVKPNKILMEAELQSRTKMLQSKVLEYSNAIRNGVSLPPVLAVKHTNGNYLLIDGWHRVLAYRICDAKGINKIPVEVQEITAGMNLHSLRFIGAMRNATQGLPLSQADKRTLFKDYIKSKSNLEGKRYKTYREIATDLGSIPHQTIARWMRSDFPSISSKMGRDGMDEQPSAKGTGNREVDMPDLSLRGLKLLILDILEQAKQANTNYALEESISLAQELVDKLKEIPRFPTSEFDTSFNPYSFNPDSISEPTF